jgi:hypothetical protein
VPPYGGLNAKPRSKNVVIHSPAIFYEPFPTRFAACLATSSKESEA